MAKTRNRKLRRSKKSKKNNSRKLQKGGAIQFFNQHRIGNIFTPSTNEILKEAVRIYCGADSGQIKLLYPIGSWNVSAITDMSNLFSSCHYFNENINNWDVSNVTDMRYMFEEAQSFNQPLDQWEVSNVTNMHGMFKNAYNFNQPIESWNVSNVTDMGSMFSDALSFNQPLNDSDPDDFSMTGWNVSNVTDMSYMFNMCVEFNQPLDRWDVSSVEDMSYMFNNCIRFNQDINNWVVSNVTDMRYMFCACENFNQPLNGWVVSSVENMSNMFEDATLFNQQLNGWDVSSVENMTEMFSGASSFNQPLNTWNVSSVEYMNRMFEGAEAFNQPIDTWQINADTEDMFEGATSYTYPIPIHVPVENPLDPNVLFNNTNTIDLEESVNYANPNDIGFNIISGEDSTVNNYLNEDPNNLVFYMNGQVSMFTNREPIRDGILNGTSIYFKCNQADGSINMNTNVNIANPYVRLNCFGGTCGGLIFLSSIKSILENDNIRIIEIVTPRIDHAVSKVSLSVLRGGTFLSSAHCQEGQQENIYELRRMSFQKKPQKNTKKRKLEN